MHYTPEILSEEALDKASPIALDFGLPIKGVAEIVETLLVSPLPQPDAPPEITKLAEILRPVMVKLHEPVCELQRFAFFGIGRDFGSESYISLPVLAAATGSYRFDALVRLREILQATAEDAAAFDSQDEVQDARRAMLVSKMALAAHHWWDMTDDLCTGAFELAGEELLPTHDSGVDYVVRVVAATDPDVTMEEMADCLDVARDKAGLTGLQHELDEQEAAEEAERAARRAKFRVVK